MDFEIPESLIHPLPGMLETESPLAARLKEHGVCHGNMNVSGKLFDARSLNTLYSLSKTQNERMLMSFIATGIAAADSRVTSGRIRLPC